ncbi:SET and MYND domain containing, class 5 isoform X2 [Lycorma delicatula]|uniref:SET and MYND domain containing, class 5 isoform X2 n=1 Tax=Lycorma delicatula TaxID=130591 RepID=UPI003F513FB5
MDPCYMVQDMKSLKGKGVVATRLIKEESVIFEETPLVCCQFSWNSSCGYKACDHCLRPLETAEENARRLAGSNDLVLPYPECCPTNKSEHAICPSCNIQYCSDKCKNVAWQQYHKSLCHTSDSVHPLNELNEIWKQIHYPPESTTIMLLARIVALVEQADDKQSVLNTFSEFCHGTLSQDENVAAQQLMGLYRNQIELLRSVFARAVPNSDVSQQWFTLEGFSSLWALVGANGQGVGTSVFSQWVSNVGNLTLPSEEKNSVDELISKIYDQMEEHTGITFLNTEGSALYALQRCVNHSCEPNAKITFPYGNSTLQLVATKDILPGDEICISYLDECALERSRHSRQKILRCSR